MFEAYEIGIRIALSDHATGPLSALTKHLLLSEAAAAKLESRLTAIKVLLAGGGLMLGAGAAIGAPLVYAIDKAAELQKQMIAIQIATRGTTAEMDSMRKGIEGIASQTVFSNIDVAKQAKMIATGTGMTAEQVQGVLPAYAKYADVQLLMKGTSPDQSIGDAIKAAHGAGHYDPASLTKYLDLLNKASLVIPGTTSEIVKGLSYFQQVSKNVLGMDDEQSVLGMALMNRMGMGGTKGGTQLGAALTRTIPGVFGSGLFKGKQQEALKAMGLIDGEGHSKMFTDGKFDMTKWMGLTADYVSREMASNPEDIARQHIMANMQRGFGTNGARAAALMGSDKAIGQWQDLEKQFGQYGSFEGMQKHFADDSVAQKWMNAKTNLVSAMTELGYTLLPAATKALKEFNTYMAKVIDWMTKNPGKVGEYATNIGKLSIALAGLGIVSIVTSGITALITALGLLRAALAAAAVAAAAPGAAAGAMGSLGGAAKPGLASKAAGVLKGLAVLGTAYEITDLIANDLLGLDNKIGGALARTFIPGYESDGTSKSAPSSHAASGRISRSFAPGAGASATPNGPIRTTINIDGRKVFEVFGSYFGRALSAPISGGYFDPTLTVPSVLLNHAN